MKLKIILFLFITFLSNLNVKCQTIKELLEKHYTDILFNELLGKGGTGEIWGSSESNIAIKGGESKNQCAKIQKEFKIQTNFYNIIKKYNETLFEKIIILKPTKIIQNIENNICAMEMPRLYPLKKNNENLITQLRLGKKTSNQTESGEIIIKGQSAGFEETKKIVNTYPKINPLKTNFNQLFVDIGTLIGILHFKQKLDGLDTELVLAKDKPSSTKYKIALIDFGMCNDLSNNFKKNKTKKIVQMLTRALTVEPIYPNPTSPQFSIFMKNYINIATEENQKNIAEKVILNFIGEQFVKKIIQKYLMKKLNINSPGSFQLKKLIPVLYKWTKGSLLFQVVAKKYNIKTKKISNFLEQIVPQIIKRKENQENLDRFEKLLLRKLKAKLIETL